MDFASSAAVRALERLLKIVSSGRQPSVRDLEDAYIAHGALKSMVSLMPQGTDLAEMMTTVYGELRRSEGMTPRVRALRSVYTQIEAAVDSCRTMRLSVDLASVDEAIDVLNRAIELVGRSDLVLTPGDQIGPKFAGAVMAASFEDGTKFEMALKRGGEEDEIPASDWLLDGALWHADYGPDAIIPTAHVVIGPVMPVDAPTMVAAHVRRLVSVAHKGAHRGLRVINGRA